MRLAHLGPRGTYTEAAAIAYMPDAELLPVATVTAAVEALERGEADGAICAMENALDGGINETIDLLLRETMALHICGEVVLPVHHVLAGASGIDLSQASVVYSHPSALAQCRGRIAQARAPGPAGRGPVHRQRHRGGARGAGSAGRRQPPFR